MTLRRNASPARHPNPIVRFLATMSAENAELLRVVERRSAADAGLVAADHQAWRQAHGGQQALEWLAAVLPGADEAIEGVRFASIRRRLRRAPDRVAIEAALAFA